MTILEAIRDPNLFAGWFRNPSTWRAWFAFLAALFALPMDAEALALYRHHTGRSEPPAEPAREAWVLVGRRGGKSIIAALVAVFLAVFRDHSAVLAPGERGTVMCLAADRRQARTVLRYVAGFFDSVPMLKHMLESRTVEAIHLTNRVSIEVHTASYRSVRGYTMVAVIADEVAFWRDESTANPDAEIIAALRPGMATVPGALLLGISSPYSRRGVLWDAYRRHYGVDGSPVIVWQGTSAAMNSTIDSAVIEQAYAEDEASASAEYGAQFRRDIEGFVSREAVDAAVVPGRRELPPVDGVRYFGFCDPSGGSSDSMTLAIAHRESNLAVLDLVREVRPPFSPEVVVEEFATTLRRYRIGQIRGDRYAAEWCAERFRKAGITYKPAEKPKSELYRELLPAINAQTVELLDHPKLIAQLCSLERRTARGGRDSIDHPPKAHDDIANVCAGVAHLVLGKRRGVSPADLYGPRPGDPDYVGSPEEESHDDTDEWKPVEQPEGLGRPSRVLIGGR